MSLFNINKGNVETPKQGGGVVGKLIQMNADNNVLMWKFPANDIARGAVIKVHQNQRALLFSSGKLIDNIGPGREVVVDSANIPGLKSLLNKALGGETSYPFEVWFANMTCERNVKIGITAEDGVLFHTASKYTDDGLSYPITAFGTYRFKLYNPETYCSKLVGTTQLSSAADADGMIRDQIKIIIVGAIQDSIDKYNGEINKFLQESRKLNDPIRAKANEEIKQEYGIEITSCNLLFKSPEYQEFAERGRKGAAEYNQLANMGRFFDAQHQYRIMEKAASNQGAGNIMGVGMGFGMGNQMGQMFGQMAQGMATQGMMGGGNMTQAVPPPVPGAEKFYFVINGQSVGPLDMATVQAHVAQQVIKPDTLAWKEGMTKWEPASTISTLASLFAPTPPPPPIPTDM